MTLATIAELRWPEGVCCPTCDRTDVRFIKTRRLWKCKEVHSKKQFSAEVGTVFEDSSMLLDKWFVASWIIANCKNGVSSYKIQYAIGITQKTTWFMLNRIHLAMQTGSFIKSGEVEADETFIGGKHKNMHAVKKATMLEGRGVVGKEVVIGVLCHIACDEQSKVVAAHIQDTDTATIEWGVHKVFEPGSKTHIDTLSSYRTLAPDYVHNVVDHVIQYVIRNVRTSKFENF